MNLNVDPEHGDSCNYERQDPPDQTLGVSGVMRRPSHTVDETKESSEETSNNIAANVKVTTLPIEESWYF